MAKQRVDLRLDERLLSWADEYALERGTTRTAIIEAAVERFQDECRRGVPELRAAAARQSSVRTPDGVGECSARGDGKGHVWEMRNAEGDGEGNVRKGDPYEVCRFGCGTLGREFFEAATSERAALFSRLRAPWSVRGTTRAEGRS